MVSGCRTWVIRLVGLSCRKRCGCGDLLEFRAVALKMQNLYFQKYRSRNTDSRPRHRPKSAGAEATSLLRPTAISTRRSKVHVLGGAVHAVGASGSRMVRGRRSRERDCHFTAFGKVSIDSFKIPCLGGCIVFTVQWVFLCSEQVILRSSRRFAEALALATIAASSPIFLLAAPIGNG